MRVARPSPVSKSQAQAVGKREPEERPDDRESIADCASGAGDEDMSVIARLMSELAGLNS